MLSNRIVGERCFLQVDNQVSVCLAYKTKKEKRQLRRRLEADLTLGELSEQNNAKINSLTSTQPPSPNPRATPNDKFCMEFAKGVKNKSIQSNSADSENAMTNHQGLSIIKTKSWSGILRHRMAVKVLMHLVDRLDYEQWSAIMETGFGGFLAVRTSRIPKQLAHWLLDHFDPWDNSLKLANHKVLEITEEHVHASFGLPMGPEEVVEAKQLDDDIQYMQFL
ncbi:hypothetical protein Cgig2_015287 [Carnegiea gigantea]|uniref:Uncharacterized protein n=1 Tax=Carnegiea gigantea TaxID=171969 RepID=A0A9Q1QF77_9CARY|nr:hypothetical protein Cgig2_015287 [Carnegiea gigantea]